MSGAGKTVLFDHLSGNATKPNYKLPLPSEAVEKGKITNKKRLTAFVLPGQEERPRLEAIEDVFRGKNAVSGVVHVVANGFIELRSQAAREFLVESGIKTLEEFRRAQIADELLDLDSTCDILRQSINKHRSPKWLLVVVTKADLFYNEITEAEKYYSPNGNSQFAERLKQLTRRKIFSLQSFLLKFTISYN